MLEQAQTTETAVAAHESQLAQDTPIAAGADASQSTPQTGSNQPNAPYARPDGLADDYWDQEKGVKFPDLLAKLNDAEALRSEAEVRKAATPASADLYQAVMPEGFKLPDGMQIDQADPRLAEARKFAHEQGLSQKQFSQMIALDVARETANSERIQTAIKARDESLGANGNARVDDLNRWFEATASSPAIAKQLSQTLFTKDIIEYFEGLKSNYVSQGIDGATRSGAGQGTDPNKIPNYENMSLTQKRAYQFNKSIGVG